MQIGKITKVPLRDLWKKEDKDFTKWLEENIEYLNEVLNNDLSIESREEKVGPFKVDLLGEDGFGNKVIIENQLEKTDHDHLGKLMTYLVNLDAGTAIWITKEPREEHGKVIEWLNEITPDNVAFYLIKIEAIRIEHKEIAAPLFTIVEGPSVEAKQIGAEKKEFAERHRIRINYWTQFLNEINKHNKYCRNHNPSNDTWIGIALGISGVSLNLVISKRYARTEIYINRGSQEENKMIFDFLLKDKEAIENIFGSELTWERMEDKITSRIKDQLDGVNYFEESDWPKINTHLIESTDKMMKSFKASIKKLRSFLDSRK
ncbi:MAG: DUF4268 domain-containing protein [Deltaproteobacteria bacterium]|nr:DUF4268 domain-containing protein [Deltaproteobacteria bacterium]